MRDDFRFGTSRVHMYHAPIPIRNHESSIMNPISYFPLASAACAAASRAMGTRKGLQLT